MESSASAQVQRERGRMASFLSERVGRARTPRVPFRAGQVVIGDDPFNGRHLGAVVTTDAPYVGLRTAGGAPGDVVFYDFRQLRYPD